jgi:hypothetical protein
MSTFLTETLNKKWSPILDNPAFPKIRDAYRREVTGVLLENTQNTFLTEAAPLTSISTGGVNNWEPVLIELIRRTMPNLVAYDICSVQPMNGPVGQIFAMRSQYADDAARANWNEALFDTINTNYSGSAASVGDQTSDMFTAAGNNLVTNSTNTRGSKLPCVKYCGLQSQNYQYHNFICMFSWLACFFTYRSLAKKIKA